MCTPRDLQVPVSTTCNIIRKCSTEAKRGNLIEDSRKRLLDCWRNRFHWLLQRFKPQTASVSLMITSVRQVQTFIDPKNTTWKSYSSAFSSSYLQKVETFSRSKHFTSARKVFGTRTMLTILKNAKLPQQVKQVRAEQCSKTDFKNNHLEQNKEKNSLLWSAKRHLMIQILLINLNKA